MRATAFSWLTFNMSRQDRTSGAAGGIVEVFTAAAALNTGDAVFLSAADTVNKSVTPANYVGFIGVVVGGQLTGDNIITTVGVAAAGTNQRVLVQIAGVATVVSGAAITAGTNFSVGPDTATAGRVIAGTTAGQVLGKALSSAGAAGVNVRILLSHR
jgi:hypothetical protein